MSRISNIIIDALSNGDLRDVSLRDIIRFLETDQKIRYTIWLEMDKHYKKQDLLDEIENYNFVHDTHHEFSEMELNEMLEDLDDRLDEDDSYFMHKRNVIERWCEDNE